MHVLSEFINVLEHLLLVSGFCWIVPSKGWIFVLKMQIKIVPVNFFLITFALVTTNSELICAYSIL